MNKGELQNLRQSTATFAGMVASFLKASYLGLVKSKRESRCAVARHRYI